MTVFITLFFTFSSLHVSAEFNQTKCPVKCKCDLIATEYVTDCTAANLRNFPDLSNITEEIYQLRLSKNKIKTITLSLSKQQMKLWALWLDNNLISVVPGKVLAKYFPAMTLLNLKSNKIIKITNTFFQGFFSLETLYLDKNYIKNITLLAFDPLANLNRLFLSNNKLVEILPEWLNNLNYLTLLDMSYNEINWIPLDINWPVTLSTLRLSHNNISLFPPLLNETVLQGNRWIYDIRDNPIFCECNALRFTERILSASGIHMCNILFDCPSFEAVTTEECKQNESISSQQALFLEGLQDLKTCKPPSNVTLTIHTTKGNMMIAECVAYGYPTPRIRVFSSSGMMVQSVPGYRLDGEVSKVLYGPVPIDSLRCETDNYSGRTIRKFDYGTSPTSVVTTNQWIEEDIKKTVTGKSVKDLCIYIDNIKLRKKKICHFDNRFQKNNSMNSIYYIL